MGKNIFYSQKLGFSLEGGRWFCEGDTVNVSAKKPDRGGGKLSCRC